MSQTKALLATLKQQLRARGVTYAQVAAQLQLSETSVKRLFAEQKFSLPRLEQVCGLIDINLAELVQLMEEARDKTGSLSAVQEQEIAADIKLLLVAICVLNLWSFDDIVGTYQVSEHECIRLLARLDRLKLIDLLPGNRFKLRVAKDFRWLPGGPIEQFFRREVQADFLQSAFAAPGEKMLFVSGMLSRQANLALQEKLEKLVSEFNQLHDDDGRLPLPQRFGSALFVALRPWEMQAFSQLRRSAVNKVF